MAKGGQTPGPSASARMVAAWKLVETGDVARARQQAQALLSDSPSSEDKAQAEELLRRTRTPPAVYGLALLVLGILVLLVALARSRY